MSSEGNRELVEQALARWTAGDGAALFRLLDDDVQWTVIGTTPISRTYNSRRDFIDNALIPMSELLEGGITPSVVNVLADGDHVVLQWDGAATTKAGRPYANRYCWVMRFRDGRIVEGLAYLDTELVSSLFQ